jgi:hypothetical protein
VNGPATALQAARYALTFFLLIALTAFHKAILFESFAALANAFVHIMAELQTQLAPSTLPAIPIRC